MGVAQVSDDWAIPYHPQSSLDSVGLSAILWGRSAAFSRCVVPLGSAFFQQRRRDIVLVDVRDVGHRLFPDPSSGDDLDVVEPDVRIKPALLRLLLERQDLAWSGVVRRK